MATAKERYYTVEHLYKTKNGYQWKEISFSLEKQSAIRTAKNEKGKNIVKEVKSITMFSDGKKEW